MSSFATLCSYFEIHFFLRIWCGCPAISVRSRPPLVLSGPVEFCFLFCVCSPSLQSELCWLMRNFHKACEKQKVRALHVVARLPCQRCWWYRQRSAVPFAGSCVSVKEFLRTPRASLRTTTAIIWSFLLAIDVPNTSARSRIRVRPGITVISPKAYRWQRRQFRSTSSIMWSPP